MKFKIWIVVMLSFLGCSHHQDTSIIKEQYLKSALEKFPLINKYESKIILGHLNDDNLLDGIIQYGKGEGMQAISQHLILVIKASDHKLAFYPFATDYCPQIDTIINQKIFVNAYDICVGVNRINNARMALSIHNNDVVEDTIWTINEEIISKIQNLKEDISNLNIPDFQEKHNFKSSMTFSAKDEMDRLLSIIDSNDIDVLLNQKSTKTEINTDVSKIQYEIRIENNVIQFFDVGEEKVAEDIWVESIIQHNFILDNNKNLIYKEYLVAG